MPWFSEISAYFVSRVLLTSKVVWYAARLISDRIRILGHVLSLKNKLAAFKRAEYHHTSDDESGRFSGKVPVRSNRALRGNELIFVSH